MPEQFIYIDESGEFGTADRSSNFMLIAALATQYPKSLKKRVWKVKAQLISQGWPKDIEIKGTSLWSSKHNPRIPEAISKKREYWVTEMLNAITHAPVQVFYGVAKKSNVSDHIMNAPYGIAYNWLAGKMLVRSYPLYKGSLNITVDQRSKETHHKMKFDGYIETQLYTECGHNEDLSITHAESHDEFGLQAVDFISWSLFRHFEHNDDQFCAPIEKVVRFVDDWYSKKKCPGKQ
ncbi:MAG: DUF3800 domain-containing protein [Rhodospirillales bacterium]|nr:DUF3800 domain-containing protein [Rhodospirillales bacterium]